MQTLSLEIHNTVPSYLRSLNKNCDNLAVNLEAINFIVKWCRAEVSIHRVQIKEVSRFFHCWTSMLKFYLKFLDCIKKFKDQQIYMYNLYDFTLWLWEICVFVNAMQKIADVLVNWIEKIWLFDKDYLQTKLISVSCLHYYDPCTHRVDAVM